MPLIFVGMITLFSFAIGRSSNERTTVVYVDKAGEVTRNSVEKPVMIVEKDDGVEVRSGRKREPYVNRIAPFKIDPWGDIVADCQTDCF